ncbi:hypothetical protein B0H13DRAFT_2313826 [Mycena leptocephala]|nr:hypothetical protein B0H13DRAFT_2313826 [Mycena leptocephala]
MTNLLDPVQKMQMRESIRSHLPPPPYFASTLSALADELARYDVEIAKVPEDPELDRLLLERAAVMSHYTDCSSLFAPIRRLPSEILSDVFGLCGDSFTPAVENVDISSVSLPTELARLAHAPLLTVSQVCTRWHSIVMGTPALWKRIALPDVLWTAPNHLDNVMELLRAALERSANHLLAIEILNDLDVSAHLPALDLIVQHSARWRRATFVCDFDDIAHLSIFKKKFPCLQYLDIHCWGSNAATALEIFRDAPHLKCVELTANTDTFPSFSLLPLNQLTEVRGDFSFDGPFVTSDIGVLVFQLYDFLPTCAQRTVEGIFAHLTLPFLTELGFGSPSEPLQSPFLWPLSSFLALSERSSFYTHLLELYLDNVAISETELLQSLEVLPGLKHLSITDHPQSPLDGSVELLITDTLLTALTCTPVSPCLVPHLNFFGCRSKLRFSDDIYLKCVLSRLQGLLGSSPFECVLWWLPGYERKLDPAVFAQIRSSCAKKELLFTFAPCYEL